MPKSRTAKKGGSLSTAALPFGLWGLKILAEQGKLPGLGKKKGKKMTAGKKRRGGAGSHHSKVAPPLPLPPGIESLVGGGPGHSTVKEALAQKVPPLGPKGGHNTTMGGGKRRRRRSMSKKRRR